MIYRHNYRLKKKKSFSGFAHEGWILVKTQDCFGYMGQLDQFPCAIWATYFPKKYTVSATQYHDKIGLAHMQIILLKNNYFFLRVNLYYIVNTCQYIII